MPKLTKTAVDKAVADPNGHDLFLYDDALKGFGLKVTPKGTKVYVVDYQTAEGRKRRFTIGRHGSWTCDEARKRADDIFRELRVKGTDPMAVKAEARNALTVAALAELYLAEGPAEKPNKKASSWKADQSNIRRHVIPLLGGKLAKAVSQADISRFQTDVAAGKSAADIKTGKRGRAMVTGGKGTAARSLAVLGAMLEFGVRRKLLPSNAAKGVKLFRNERRERFLCDADVVALADALAAMEEERTINDSMADAVRLLMLTGCRKSEITTLRWEWVDFERSCLQLPDSKTGAKTVPLGAAALEILADLWAAREASGGSVFVLPAIKGDGHMVGLQRAWEKVRERAGLPGAPAA